MNFLKEPFLLKYRASEQLLLFFMLAIICMVVFTSIGVFGAIGFFNVNIFTNPEVMKQANEPNVLAALQLMQTMQAIGLFIVPSIGFAMLASHNKWKYLQVNSAPKILPLLAVVIMAVVAIPFINYLGEWNSHLPFPKWVYDREKEAEEMLEAFLGFNSIGLLFFNLFMMAILPALGEEFVFRGILQKLFYNLTRNKHITVWTAAILFSAMHMQFLGFFPRMLLGAMFGYMAIESGNLWYSIIAHFINNAVAVTTTYLINTEMIATEIETFGINNFGVSIISTVLMILAMIAFGKLIEKSNSNSV